VIIKFNGNAVHNERELPQMVAKISATIPIEVVRNGKYLTMEAIVAELQNQEVSSARAEDHPAAKWGLSVQRLTQPLAQQPGIHNELGVAVSNVLQD